MVERQHRSPVLRISIARRRFRESRGFIQTTLSFTFILRSTVGQPKVTKVRVLINQLADNHLQRSIRLQAMPYELPITLSHGLEAVAVGGRGCGHQ